MWGSYINLCYFQCKTQILSPISNSAVTAVDKSPIVGTEVTISCIVNGITRQLDTVTWTKSDGSLITSGQDGLTVDPGIFSGSSQTTTLTVAGPQNNQDTTYNCVVTSNELGITDKSTAVNLEVFSECANCGTDGKLNWSVTEIQDMIRAWLFQSLLFSVLGILRGFDTSLKRFTSEYEECRHENTDYNSGDMGKVSLDTVIDCVAACLATTGCIAVTFVSPDLSQYGSELHGCHKKSGGWTVATQADMVSVDVTCIRNTRRTPHKTISYP